jgi:hypothetical protein
MLASGGVPAGPIADAPLAAGAFEGFSHWPGEPAPNQQCTLTTLPNWLEIAGWLPQLLIGAYAWTAPLPLGAGAAPTAPEDNPTIPSGYTYLLQFTAHDLVDTATPFWAVDERIGTSNLRTQRLRLAALYGGGPGDCPYAYAPAGPDGQARFALRLGCFEGLSAATSPFRDMQRVAIPAPAPPPDGALPVVETLIADPRNADNAVLAQVAVLFAMLHNKIAAAIDANPGFPSAPSQTRRAKAVFDAARTIVTRVYRRIILDDLFERLLHPDVRDAYRRTGAVFWRGGGTPLELSHGVLRFGHAMLRDFYVLNKRGRDAPIELSLRQTLNFASPSQIGSVALPMLWAVQWSRFFDMGGGVMPNYSRRIGPGMSTILIERDLFEPIGAGLSGGLPHRDTMSALRANLWSVNALIEAIAPHAPGLLPQTWPFRDPRNRAGAIHGSLEALHRLRLGDRFPDDFASAVANDPPLPLFVLLEAARDPDILGKHLGRLGSIILADVVYALAGNAADPPDIAKTVLPAADAAAVARIDSMPTCIRYVAEGLPADGDLPFF